MNPRQEYDYSAFISYKREDEKWAKWLQNHLERYSIPATIRKDIPRIPKRIKPVFRDKTDLGAGGLSYSIHKELECSHLLIVICSPNSAKSDWVGKEISYFRGLGREDSIVPFIIEGVPHSVESDKECFHPVFSEFKDEPLGINVKEIGKQQAVVKIIAKILDLRFDQLWERHKRYQRTKRIRLSLLALLCCIMALLYWFYTKPVYKYYADYVDQWGIPKGIIELDETTFKHRNRSYRFEYRRIPLGEKGFLSWRLSKVEYVNSIGIPQDYDNAERENRYAILKFDYNSSSGTLKNIDCRNKYGKTIARWKISSKDGVKATLIDFIGVTDLEASSYLNSITTVTIPYGSFSTNMPKSSIKRYVLTRNKLGYITSISYHASNSDNLNQSSATDVNGVHKLNFANDSIGRILSTTYQDLNGNPTARKDGICIRTFKYDKWGNICNTSFYNQNGNLVLNGDLCARIKVESDSYGNIIRERYYGKNDSLCFNNKKVSQSVVQFDEKGFPLNVTYLDTENRLCTNSEGYSKLHIECDSRGNQITNWYESITGKPCTSSKGWAKVSVEYNRKGYQTHIAYFRLNGSLAQLATGIAGWNNKYDRDGNCIQGDFFGADYNACCDNNGVAQWKCEYDERGLQTQLSCYDINYNLANCKDGWALQRYKYDDRGNLVENMFFDKAGKPTQNKKGYHAITTEYDEYGNIIGIRYYDNNKKLCKSNEGYAFYKAIPDYKGNIAKVEYFGANGKPTKTTEGIEVVEATYDLYGRVTKINYYNSDGVPLKVKTGLFGWQASYDSRGNKISYKGLDSLGRLCGDTTGIAKWEKRFDERGNQIIYASYDENNALKAAKNGVAYIRCKYNDIGLQEEISYFNEQKRPCVNKDVRYSSYYAKYDKKGETLEVGTYDNKGHLCLDPTSGFAKWKAKYDNSGNKIEMLSFNERGELYVCKYGYAKYIARFDKEGDLIESYSYDAYGKLIEESIEKNTTHDKIKRYDSHRFRYDTVDIIFGLLFFVAFLFMLFLWVKKVRKNTCKENICCIAGIVALCSFDYIYLRKILLYMGMLSYNINNYSWLLLAIGTLPCIVISIGLLLGIYTRILSIFRAKNNNRRNVFREYRSEIGVSFMIAAYLLFVIYYFIDQGLDIYNNPL